MSTQRGQEIPFFQDKLETLADNTTDRVKNIAELRKILDESQPARRAIQLIAELGLGDELHRFPDYGVKSK